MREKCLNPDRNVSYNSVYSDLLSTGIPSRQACENMQVVFETGKAAFLHTSPSKETASLQGISPQDFRRMKAQTLHSALITSRYKGFEHLAHSL